MKFLLIFRFTKHMPESTVIFCQRVKGRTELTRDFAYSPADGTVIGTHNGAHYYTVGQRKGLNIGGKAEPLFVLKPDTAGNYLYVGMGHAHPGLKPMGTFHSRSRYPLAKT